MSSLNVLKPSDQLLIQNLKTCLTTNQNQVASSKRPTFYKFSVIPTLTNEKGNSNLEPDLKQDGEASERSSTGLAKGAGNTSSEEILYGA